MLKIYSKKTCGYCTNLKTWLKNNGFEFEEIKVDEDPEALKFIKAQGHQTVPQVYLDDKLLVDGGYTGTVKLGAVALRELLKKV